MNAPYIHSSFKRMSARAYILRREDEDEEGGDQAVGLVPGGEAIL